MLSKRKRGAVMDTTPEIATPVCELARNDRNGERILRSAQNDREMETAKEILEKLAAWVQAQEADKLSVQNLKHATGVLKDLREILKSDMPDKPVEIIVQIGDEEYAK